MRLVMRCEYSCTYKTEQRFAHDTMELTARSDARHAFFDLFNRAALCVGPQRSESVVGDDDAAVWGGKIRTSVALDGDACCCFVAHRQSCNEAYGIATVEFYGWG